MAETDSSVTTEIDVNKANEALDLAFGIVDALFTLDANAPDGINGLCKDSASALLDAAMNAISSAKMAINPCSHSGIPASQS